MQQNNTNCTKGTIVVFKASVQFPALKLLTSNYEFRSIYGWQFFLHKLLQLFLKTDN